MREQKQTIFGLNRRNQEVFKTKFKADDRSENWQPLLLLLSTQLLAYRQEYLRSAAKELAKMTANGVLEMPKISVIRDTIKENIIKELVVPENADEIIETLDAFINTYGTQATV